VQYHIPEEPNELICNYLSHFGLRSVEENASLFCTEPCTADPLNAFSRNSLPPEQNRRTNLAVPCSQGPRRVVIAALKRPVMATKNLLALFRNFPSHNKA